MAGIVIMPMAAQVAMPEPEMAPKKVQATTVAMARPPVRRPSIMSARPMSCPESPPFPMKIPASTKKNTASMGKESSEL